MSIIPKCTKTLFCFFIISIFASNSNMLEAHSRLNKEQSCHLNPFASPALFSEFNVGPNFLTFYKVGFNKSRPGGVTPPSNFKYNRTPLFEYIVGYRLNSWFKFGLSYQNQSGVSVYAPEFIVNSLIDNRIANIHLALRSLETFNLDIDGLMAKVYFSVPDAIKMGPIASNFFLGLGLGASWQTYSMGSYTLRIPPIFNVFPGLQVQGFTGHRTVTNASFMIDAGMKTTSCRFNPPFSISLGCKFNYWGQMRNIPCADTVTLKVKKLYSFAPYLGWTWNFPVETYTIKKRTTDTWHPFIAQNTLLNAKPSLAAEINIGPSFTRFSKTKGNMMPVPPSIFQLRGNTETAPLQGSLNSSYFPLIEYAIGYQIFPWFKTGISYQYQTPTPVRSEDVFTLGIRSDALEKLTYISYFSINSLMLKFGFEFPYAAVIKKMALNPYLGAGCGASWQSWTSGQTLREDTGGTTPSRLTLLQIRDKNIANASWMIDLGLKLKNATPDFLFSILFGCKYNQWGQVRNIGKTTEQDNFGKGLFRPIKAKIMYSFTPYIAAQWNFPTAPFSYKKASSFGFRSSAKIEQKNRLFTSLNIGPGFLFFHKVRGNLTVEPVSEAPYVGNATDLDHLNYNVAPLFDYSIGYRFHHAFNFAFSYLYQPRMSVSSKVFQGDPIVFPLLPNDVPNTELRTFLSLNALLGKVTLETPFALLIRNWASSLYAGFGGGVGWQTWSNPYVIRSLSDSQISDGYLNVIDPLKEVIMSNFAFQCDAGFRIRNNSFMEAFSLQVGCKYTQWGRLSKLGSAKNQFGNSTAAIQIPVRIQIVGSVTPYIGFQWNF